KAAHGDWADARKVLDDSARFKLLDAPVLRRRRAVLLAAEALDADRRGESEAALERANDALSLDPGLLPAAILAAKKLAGTGKLWRAQNVIEACWAIAPHPDLAEAYAAMKPDESHEQRGAPGSPISTAIISKAGCWNRRKRSSPATGPRRAACWRRSPPTAPVRGSA